MDAGTIEWIDPVSGPLVAGSAGRWGRNEQESGALLECLRSDRGHVSQLLAAHERSVRLAEFNQFLRLVLRQPGNMTGCATIKKKSL